MENNEEKVMAQEKVRLQNGAEGARHEAAADRYAGESDMESAAESYFLAADRYDAAGNDGALCRVLERITDLLEGSCYPLYYPDGAIDARRRLIGFYAERIDREAGNYFRLAGQQYKLWQFCFSRGRLEESRKAALEILRTDKRYKRKFGPHPYLADMDRSLVRIYRQSPTLSFSEPYTDEQAKRYETVARKYPALYMERLAGYYLSQGKRLADAGETEQAERLWLKSLEKYKRSYDDAYEIPPSILTVCRNLAILYECRGAKEEALKMWRRGLRYSRMFARLDDNFERCAESFRNAMEEAGGRA